jgi:phenylacetate-CoA ligase
VMPLIRYRLEDLAELDEDAPCACGRTYRGVRRITGRVVDVVVTPDGRHVGGLAAAFLDASGIRLCQIVQESVDEIEVNMVKARTYTPRDGETVERELRTRLGDALRIRLNFVDSIPPGRNGKIQFIVSKPGKAAVRGRAAAGRQLPTADGSAVTTHQ